MLIYEKNDIDKVVEILNKDGVIAFPTETVFGLGIKSDKESNYIKLVKVKNRAPNKPFTLMISKISQIDEFLELSNKALKIINKYLPGPLTLVLKVKNHAKVPYFIDLGSGFVGIRMPNDKFILDLIDKINCPLLVPSANKSNELPAKNIQEIEEIFDGELDCVINGRCGSGVPSTVAKIDGDNIKILREGDISLSQLEDVL